MRKRINLLEPSTEYLTMYHGTQYKNLPSILKRGIQPRKPEYYDKLYENVLKEKGLNPETVYKEYGRTSGAGFLKRELAHSKRTRVGKVYMSPKKEYAIQNALAGKEVETKFRQYTNWMKKGPTESEYETRKEHLASGADRRIALLKLRVPKSKLGFYERGEGKPRKLKTGAWGEGDVWTEKGIDPEEIKNVEHMSRWDYHDTMHRKFRPKMEYDEHGNLKTKWVRRRTK